MKMETEFHFNMSLALNMPKDIQCQSLPCCDCVRNREDKEHAPH
jgi:hypothetical protein